MWIVYYLPKKLLSRIVGVLAYIPLPHPLSTILISWFVALSGASVEEAEHSLKRYRSIGAFFIRSLKTGCRPIEGDFVSPIDGTLRSIEPIAKGQLHQVKGMHYSVEELVGDRDYAAQFEGGTCYNFYLSPKDYHHVHVPVAGTLTHARLLQGTLWPVNEWSFARIDGLFVKNERIVMRMDTEQGPCAVIMVGALNVGAMRVSFDETLRSYVQYPSSGKVFEEQYNPGSHLGYFRLGSSVLLLMPPEHRVSYTQELPTTVRMGETLTGERP